MPEETSISADQIILSSLSEYPIYSKNYLKIQTKKGFLVPFELNEVQTLLEQIFNDIRDKGRLLRAVILKARRKGVSTLVSGKFYYKTTTNSNRYAMIVTHEPEATDFIFKMHKRFQDHVPEHLRPSERYNNRKVLEFNTERGDGLDSAIRVGTAGKEDFGSAQLIHYLHLSELAKYPRHLATNLLLSLLQCVPDTEDTAVIMESTGKGVGGEFYDRYWGSRYHYEFYLKDGKAAYREVVKEDVSEDNEYTSIFIPWFVFDEYRMPARQGFTRTEFEQKLVDAHGITNDHLQWRRWCIENKCKGDEALFNQEYPTTARDAFLSSTDNVFDLVKLDALAKIAPAPRTRYNILLPMCIFTTENAGKFRVWEEPRFGFQYIIGVDVAEGVIGGDFSVVDVICYNTGQQVAQWHGRISPDQVGLISSAVGLRYNVALIVVERNNQGQSVLDKLLDLSYPKLYTETIHDPPHKPRKRYGWLTTKKTKPKVIENLIAELRDNVHGIQCKETFQEMMFYKQFEDGTMGAESGATDDRVMSFAIAKYVLGRRKPQGVVTAANLSYNQLRRSNVAPPVSPRGWT